MDFLLTHSDSAADCDNMRPRASRFCLNLLEFNAEPAINMTGDRLGWILEDLFTNIGRTFITPFVRRFLQFDSDGLNQKGEDSGASFITCYSRLRRE